ncbi:MAG: endonuclease/exonuclease/phosphatase family protein [Kiritimatiellia bacterium]|jgi:endonuclease/exonuclease/phosphatase family metal-dependent hydrolase
MKGQSIRRALVFAVLVTAALAWEFLPAQIFRPTPAPAADTIKVASWNLLWFPSGYPEPQPKADEARRLAATARFIRTHGMPDVFFFQEIRDDATCQALAGQLGPNAPRPVVCSAFKDYGTQKPALQQLAIFSRFPVVDSGFEPWSAADFVYPPRGYAYALLDIRGALVACFTVHLKSNYIPEGEDPVKQATLNRLKRELAAEQLLRRIARLEADGHKGRPVKRFIVAGDFNTSIYENRFAKETTIRTFFKAGFRNAFEGCTGEDYATLPASPWFPAAFFDYILVKGLNRAAPPETLPKFHASDHRMIRATLKP